jgi:hypothetical protein
MRNTTDSEIPTFVRQFRQYFALHVVLTLARRIYRVLDPKQIQDRANPVRVCVGLVRRLRHDHPIWYHVLGDERVHPH